MSIVKNEHKKPSRKSKPHPHLTHKIRTYTNTRWHKIKTSHKTHTAQTSWKWKGAQSTIFSLQHFVHCYCEGSFTANHQWRYHWQEKEWNFHFFFHKHHRSKAARVLTGKPYFAGSADSTSAIILGPSDLTQTSGLTSHSTCWGAALISFLQSSLGRYV